MLANLHRTLTTMSCLPVLALAACGSDARRDPPGVHGSSSVPPNVTISVDYTTARSGAAIARSYAGTTRVLADQILVSGGRLRVVVSAGAGVAPAELVDEVVPFERDLRGNARKRYLVKARGALAILVDQALGIVPADNPRLQAALAAMSTDGSDVAGAVLHPTKLLTARGGGTLYVLSDGLQRGPEIDFASTIEAISEADAISKLKPLLPAAAAHVAIDIRGVGLNGAPNVSTERSSKLERVWDGACNATGSPQCSVSTDV